MTSPRHGSLAGRIIGLHLVAVAVICATIPFAAWLLLGSTASQFQEEALRRHAAVIAAGLHRDGDAWRLDLPPDLKTLYAGGYAGFGYSVVDADGRVRFSSLPGGAPLFRAGYGARSVTLHHRAKGGAVYYGASFPERVDGAPAWVQVGQNLQNPDVVVDDIMAAFLRRFAWLVLPILLGLAAADFFIVRRALQPVLDASRRAAAIGPQRLAVRLPAAGLPSEIAPLAEAVNAALDRLEQGYRMQREFTADAAHELRTPLAILRMRVAALPDRAASRALEQDIDVMARIVGQLLSVADLEAFVLAPERRTDLYALGAQVVEYMAPYALAQGRELALEGADAPVWVLGDADVLFQAVRNLVENALRHTPPGTTVEVEVASSGEIRVLDHGPGVAEEERESVFRRFWRRERNRSEGAGLGLAIVARIVEAHGGAVAVEARPGGGAAFVIRLRAAQPPQSPES